MACSIPAFQRSSVLCAVCRVLRAACCVLCVGGARATRDAQTTLSYEPRGLQTLYANARARLQYTPPPPRSFCDVFDPWAAVVLHVVAL